jgi:hypothetical protein
MIDRTADLFDQISDTRVHPQMYPFFKVVDKPHWKM